MTELDLMLHTLSVLDAPKTIFTYVGTCPTCLSKTEYHTRIKPDFAEASVLCRNCMRSMDAVVSKTDTMIR